MTKPFIFVGTRAINLEQVIDAEFVPSGPKVSDAKLSLTTTERNWERDGDTERIVPVNMTHSFYGIEAEAVWDYIKAIGVDVVALAAAKRRNANEALAESEAWTAGRR